MKENVKILASAIKFHIDVTNAELHDWLIKFYVSQYYNERNNKFLFVPDAVWKAQRSLIISILNIKEVVEE